MFIPDVKEPDLSTVTPDVSSVRRWASDNNITVGKRGRLPASLVNQYVRAMRS